jgi:meso-butanediol dehydrogenase/(S,S)-butanediol dehydrogenase/diacetyl reductase
MADGRVAGKVVLISGTGSGQGRAAAELFASEGATVIGSDVDVESAEETVALVREKGFEMESVTPVDATDRADLKRWIDHAAEQHGGIDVLYNNASRQHFAPFPEMTKEEYDFTIANEIDVVWHPTQIAWPHLAARQGAIVNIASIAGVIGARNLPMAAHSATKGAVIGLTRQMAAEGAAFGIRANSISPGVIASPPVQALIDEMGDEAPMMDMVRATASGLPGQPIDIAYAALYLASDEARWVTGSNLVVDGGATVLI